MAKEGKTDRELALECAYETLKYCDRMDHVWAPAIDRLGDPPARKKARSDDEAYNATDVEGCAYRFGGCIGTGHHHSLREAADRFLEEFAKATGA